MADGWDSYPHDWDERRRAVYQRDEYQCQNCGRRGGAAGNAELHCHHIVPKSKGGSHDASNLITLCRNCHNQVHDHHIPKMSNVSSGGQSQNAGLDDWQSSTQASEGLQQIADDYFESTESIEKRSVGDSHTTSVESDQFTQTDSEVRLPVRLKIGLFIGSTFGIFFASYISARWNQAVDNVQAWIALMLLFGIWWYLASRSTS